MTRAAPDLNAEPAHHSLKPVLKNVHTFTAAPGRIVIAIIVISLGALAWLWHSAHTSAHRDLNSATSLEPQPR